jgi:WD40 repeat protein
VKPRQGRSRRKMTLVAILLVMAVVLTVWVVRSLAAASIDPVAVAGLLVTAAALAFQVASFVTEGSRDGARTAAAEADELAAVLAQEWQGEVETRRLRNPRVLPLTWTESRRAVADSPQAVIVGASSGVRVSLRLSGRLDSGYEEATRKLAESFLCIPSKRLLILGEPGAGKSVLALLLGLGLLGMRSAGRPVPVLLPLSSWDPLSQDLETWIAQYLAIAYYNGDATAPRALLRGDLLLPILDGLDEIPEPLRRTATREINRAVKWDRGVVVTCRSVEYEDLIEGGAPTLKRAPVVEVSPVPPADAIGYLRSVDWADGVEWDAVYATLTRSPDGPLAQALSTPLMIGFARAVYERMGGRPEELTDEQRFAARHTVEEYLTDKVLDAAYAPVAGEADATVTRWTPTDARRWLTFLARHMQQHRERELLWWLLPARLLPWWVGPVIGLACGTLVAVAAPAWTLVFSAAGDGTSNGLYPDVDFGVLVAVLVMVVWFAAEGRPPGRLSLTRRESAARLRRGFLTGVIAMVTVGFPVLVAAAAFVAVTGSWTVSAVESLYVAIAAFVLLTGVAGLVTAADTWSSAQPSGAGHASPRLTMRQDRRLAWWGSAIPALVAGLLFLPACATGLALGALVVRGSTGWSGWPGAPEPGSVLGSALQGLAAYFRSAPVVAAGWWIFLPALTVYIAFVMTRAWPRFAIFRLLMALRRRLPLDLPRFLDDARSRNLLRQAAGAYQFSHARLQESLANAPAQSGRTAALERITRRRPRTAAVLAAVVLAIPFVTLPSNNAVHTLPGLGPYRTDSDVSPRPRDMTEDGRLLAVATGEVVTVWSVADGQDVGEFADAGGVVVGVTLSPNGQLLVVEKRENLRTVASSRFTVWDVHRKQVLARDLAKVVILAGGDAMVTAGLAGAGRQEVDLWNTAAGEQPQPHALGVRTVDQVKFPSTSVVADRFVAVDDAGQPALFVVRSGEQKLLQPLEGMVGATVTFDESGTLLVGTTPTGLRLWRAADGTFVGDVQAGFGAVAQAAPVVNGVVKGVVVAEGRPRSTAADTAAVAIYRVEEGQSIQPVGRIDDPQGYDAPSVGPEGRLVAVSTPEPASTRILDPTNGQQVGVLVPARASFLHSPKDGAALPLLIEKVASADTQSAVDVQVWDRDGRPLTTLRASQGSANLFADTRTPTHTVVWHGETGNLDVVVAGNGRAAAAVHRPVEGGSSTLRLYDLRSGRAPEELPGDLTGDQQSGFSSDGSLFAAVYKDEVRLWDVQSHKVTRINLPPSGPPSRRTVALSPDGRTLTTVDPDADVAQVWDTQTGGRKITLRGHSGPIETVLYSGERRICTFGSADRTVRVYDLPG